MVTGYFGVPGCGKSTFLAMIASKELKRIQKGKSKYKHVLTNFYVKGCEKIQLYELGQYDIEDCLILLDEVTLDADARDYKKFAQSTKTFFTLHRHTNNDIIYFCQDFSRVDKTIRNVTYDLWYIKVPYIPFFKNFSIASRIFRNININEYNSELVLGYRFGKLIESFFVSCKKFCFRPFYYKYFNSFDKLQLDQLPEYNYKRW